jgi:3-hydroxypropanoate dehydrogenase
MASPQPPARTQAKTMNAHEQAFLSARTFNKFKPDAVSDETLKQLYDLLKWGPTSLNAQPGRYVFLRTADAKQRLKPALSPGNTDKTMAAPVVVIVAMDTQFQEFLPAQVPAMPAARGMFDGNAALIQATAFRNSSLQGAYLIVAARLLGLDCGPMSGFDTAKVDAEFFPDGRWKSNFLINLGHGDASGNYPRGPRLPFETAVQLL